MARLYYGGYGHHPSGKQYVYLGGDNYRTGQNVVAPVTNWRSGKTYNTMFTIQRTSGYDSPMEQNEMSRLEGEGIDIKWIEGRGTFTLPGSEGYKSGAEWQRASDEKYARRVAFRTNFASNKPLGSNLRTTLLRRFR